MDTFTFQDADEEQKSREKKESLVFDYKKTFATESGERVLKDILSQGLVEAECLIPGKPDATAYNLGRRSLALMIKSQVERVIKK